jgi:hypothetical protein
MSAKLFLVHDRATDVTFAIDVNPADSIDAFYHPYAYAAKRHTQRATG